MSQLFNLEKPELIGLVLFWTVPVSYMLNMCRICNSCCCLLSHQAGWLINNNIRFEKLYLCNTNTSVSKVFSFLTVVAHCYCEYCTFTWSDSTPLIFLSQLSSVETAADAHPCVQLTVQQRVSLRPAGWTLPWEPLICFHLQQKSLWCIATVGECSVWSSPGLFKW